MQGDVGRQVGVAGRVEENTVETMDVSSNDSDAMEVRVTVPPITEISDKDYRSFCLPCYALEESGDD